MFIIIINNLTFCFCLFRNANGCQFEVDQNEYVHMLLDNDGDGRIDEDCTCCGELLKGR